MKRLLIFVILTLSAATGDKELSPPSAKGDSLNKLLSDPSLSDLLNDPDLWLILKKRLGTPMECMANSRRNNSIIKTKDSLDAGATFIAAPTVPTDKECEKECCKEKACNTAVLKIKGGRSDELACYLFDCKTPNLCVFTSHPGFTVLDFSYARDPDSHAHDLDQLAMSSASTLASTTTTATTTTVATTTVAKAVRPQNNGGSKSDLFGECHQTSDCRDQNTDCLAGYCVCQQGYHVVEMQCRKDCNQELEYECNNKGSPLFAECIAVYDYCDGIAQCSDGSDETSCLDNSKHKASDPDVRVNGGHQIVQNTNPPSTASPVPEAQPSVHNIPAKSLNLGTTTATAAPPVKSSLVPDAAKSSLAGPSSTHHDPLSVQIKQESQAPDTNAEVKEEKVERFFLPMEKNKGAVIALILGIILTTTLIILAGCRLRHFRKRYRKGRHLNSNEADYLINGMYL